MYYYYRLQIADIVVQIDSEIELLIDNRMANFVIEDKSLSIDQRIQIIVQNHDFVIQNVIFDSEYMCVCQSDEGFVYYYRMNRDNQRGIAELTKNDCAGTYILHADNVFKKMFQQEGKVVSFFAMEDILLKNAGFYLHSSFVKYRECAILFTAPSGFGKSTQANLWKKYRNAQVINGDKTIVRNKNGKFMAYGSPYAGSSEIYCNDKAMIKAIVVLRKASTNEIIRLKGRAAILPLYQETLINVWDAYFVERVLDILTDLVGKIPVYQLSCRPDIGAVELVEQTLFG